jgi:hypothetical protein
MRLNGWQRLWVVFSVLWTVGLVLILAAEEWLPESWGEILVVVMLVLGPPLVTTWVARGFRARDDGAELKKELAEIRTALENLGRNTRP